MIHDCLFILISTECFQSCLALRYEALHMRELKSTSCQWLEVSYLEWLNFAEHSLDNGFYSIAGKVISILFYFDSILVLLEFTSR